MIKKFIDSIYSLALSNISSDMSGVGGVQDVAKSFRINRVKPVNESEIASLYLSSGLIQKIIDLIPSLSKMVEIKVTSTSGDFDSSGITKKLKDLKLLKQFSQASISARLFRESYLLFDIDDGQGYDQPINWDTCKGLSDFYFLEMGSLIVNYNENRTKRISYELNLNDRNDESIKIQNNQIIHADRVLLFTGKELTPKLEQMNSGQHSSLLDGLVEQYGTLAYSYNNAASIISRVLTFIFKMAGLRNFLDVHGKQKILERLQMVKGSIGSIGGILTELETEEIEAMTVSLAGIPETIDSLKQYFTAQSELTHDQLWNEGSIDTKSELEDKNFQRIIKSFISNNWIDNWQYLCKIVSYEFTDKIDDLTFTLELPEPDTTLKEELEAKYLQAQIDQIYVNLEVLTREIVQGNRFGTTPFQTNLTQTSNEGLDELDKKKEEQAQQTLKLSQAKNSNQSNQSKVKDSNQEFMDASYKNQNDYKLTSDDVQEILKTVSEENPLIFAFMSAESVEE